MLRKYWNIIKIGRILPFDERRKEVDGDCYVGCDCGTALKPKHIPFYEEMDVEKPHVWFCRGVWGVLPECVK